MEKRGKIILFELENGGEVELNLEDGLEAEVDQIEERIIVKIFKASDFVDSSDNKSVEEAFCKNMLDHMKVRTKYD